MAKDSTKFKAKKIPKLTLKVSVAVALLVSLSALSVILVAGLFLPKSVLLKLSGDSSSTKNGVNGPDSALNDTSATGGSDKQTVTENAATPPTATTNQTTTSTAPTSSSGAGSTTKTPTSGGSTAPVSGGGTAAVPPTLTFSGSPTSVTTGGSSTLSWSVNNTATAPVSCTATGGSFAGAKATSGSQSLALSATTTFTMTCTNSAGSSGAKTVTVTVTAPVSACKAGGTCSAADVAPHNSNGNCWVAVTGTGYNKVYVITSSFNTSHQSTAGKAAASAVRTCGKVISIGTLRGYNGDHTNGAKIGGSTFDTWMNSFYYANYQ